MPIDGNVPSEFQSTINNRQSAVGNVLRDGVTGNTSGFELEDEGSTPSLAARYFNRNSRYFDLIDVMANAGVEYMVG